MSPEQAQPVPVPSLRRVNAAYSEIVEHNNQHSSLGAGMANVFRAIIESSESVDLNDPETPKSKDVPEAFDEHIERAVSVGDTYGEFNRALYEGIFDRIGVKIAPIGSHVTSIAGEKVTSTSLVPTIENSELYRDFLGTLKPEDVEKSENQHLLQALLGNLESKISRCFDPKEREKIPEDVQAIVDQAGEGALKAFVKIAPEYKRLGLDGESLRKKFSVKPEGKGYIWLSDDAPQEQRDEQASHQSYKQAHNAARTFETLQDYVNYRERDILPEFIIADGGQYLTKPEDQGFGPADWQYDGGQRRWRPALEFVAELTRDDRTRAFAEEVRNGLVNSLDAAIGRIDGEREEREYVVNQREDLVNIKNALTGQKYDAERLADYTKEPDYSGY